MPSRAPQPCYTTLPNVPQPPPTVLDYLERRFPRVGRAVWSDRLARGLVLDDATGEPLPPSAPYRRHLRVRYFREVAAEPAVTEAEEILHQDAHLLVACKPHGLPVTPAGRHVNACLLYRLQLRTGLVNLAPLHRLDQETAGLVLFAVQPAERAQYHALFLTGAVRKTYEAVARAPAADAGPEWLVESRIVRGTPWFRAREVPGRPNARTRLRLLERQGDWARFTAEPLTGKTHQLRLHFCHIGCPIRHDWLYPELQPEPKPASAPPLQLLARTLAFTDPCTGQELCFHSPRRLVAWED